jgi:hypothetical protein
MKVWKSRKIKEGTVRKLRNDWKARKVRKVRNVRK